MGYWLKLYTDVLDDPKYFKLSDEARLGMYELLLVAKKLENGELTGNIPNIEDVAFHTRRELSWWKSVMPELEQIGFVEKKKIRNYKKRQEAIPVIERVKQSRRKRNDNAMETVELRNCNESVTNRNGEESREEVETEKNKNRVDVECDNDNLLAFSSLFEELTHIKAKPEQFYKLVNAGATPDHMRQAFAECAEKKFNICKPEGLIQPTLIVLGRKNGRKKTDKTDYKSYA